MSYNEMIYPSLSDGEVEAIVTKAIIYMIDKGYLNPGPALVKYAEELKRTGGMSKRVDIEWTIDKCYKRGK